MFESALFAAPQRCLGGGLEAFDIDLELGIGCKRDDVVADRDEVVGTERAAREMHGFAQAGSCRLRVGVRPEGLHRLLAVHAMRWLQRQQLDQRGGAVASPVGPDGFGTCYIEFGGGRIGKVEVDFFSGPAPTGNYYEPSVALRADKEKFGSSRRLRWFGS
ncbi:hypothetical protein LB572_01440 [Mesorhizobium sp. BH1-1-5]|uniref:hypothetical protein n=1 Tax=Mesorhizobium sp. BH1-1-5 TaxID=2876661 RepID=UPI001CCD2294|nr:hypothetical protein [Mesorhizobium sp. BH1-1-5]MBZ9985753.1 hypothetical protein [Mesorhizobium sp. BH1-1-5]